MPGDMTGLVLLSAVLSLLVVVKRSFTCIVRSRIFATFSVYVEFILRKKICLQC